MMITEERNAFWFQPLQHDDKFYYRSKNKKKMKQANYYHQSITQVHHQHWSNQPNTYVMKCVYWFYDSFDSSCASYT